MHPRLAVLVACAVSAVVLARAPAARADNWGCDLVNSNTGAGFVDDCGMQGACCDAHDEGYRALGCSMSSWFHTACAATGTYCGEATACDAVNETAVMCVLTQSPGPGLCCDLNGQNVCQQSRNPNHYWGCANDAFCDFHSRCNVAAGVCEPICQNETPTQCGVGWTDSCGNQYEPVGCRDGLSCVSGTCRQCDSCASHPGQCGLFDDGCGREIACGCSGGLTCEYGSCAEVCRPYTCADYGQDGYFPDGCGGELSCGDPGNPGDPGSPGDPGDPGDPGGPGGGVGDPGGGDPCDECVESDPDCGDECGEEQE
jgi:hypothetical protein